MDFDNKDDVRIMAGWTLLVMLTVGTGIMIFVRSIYDFTTKDNNFINSNTQYEITYNNKKYCTYKYAVKGNEIKFTDLFNRSQVFPEKDTLIKRGCE